MEGYVGQVQRSRSKVKDTRSKIVKQAFQCNVFWRSSIEGSDCADTMRGVFKEYAISSTFTSDGLGTSETPLASTSAGRHVKYTSLNACIYK